MSPWIRICVKFSKILIGNSCKRIKRKSNYGKFFRIDSEIVDFCFFTNKLSRLKFFRPHAQIFLNFYLIFTKIFRRLCDVSVHVTFGAEHVIFLSLTNTVDQFNFQFFSLFVKFEIFRFLFSTKKLPELLPGPAG